MFPKRRSNSLNFICFISSAIVLLIFLRGSFRITTTKSIQFEHKNGEIGDQLFSLFSHLGVARTIDRIPVINTVNNSNLIEHLSKTIVIRFPSILQQFSIVIQPPTPVNGELGNDQSSYEDPLEKFSEYAALSIMVKGNGFRNYKYFDHLRSQIRLWMLGNAENVEEAKSLMSESFRDNFKVCMHTTSETQKNFTIKAISQILDHYTKEHNQVMLVISNTDSGFSREVFNHSKLKKFDIEKFSLVNSSPEVQLTFSRIYCDAVFLTVPYSTFGWWLGYLAKDEKSHVFYFDPEMFPKYKNISHDFFPPDWVKLSRKL